MRNGIYVDFSAGDSRSPLYERLTDAIRRDIVSGKWHNGDRLPSRRSAARDLGLSCSTVEIAYEQLEAEGYIESRPRSGYYVTSSREDGVGPSRSAPTVSDVQKPARDLPKPPPAFRFDLVESRISEALFPISVWARLTRRVLLDGGTALLRPAPPFGLDELRDAVAESLADTRGISVTGDRILIDSGNMSLCRTLTMLLGVGRTFGVEYPGFSNVTNMYVSCGVRVVRLPMDDRGVSPDALRKSGVEILHISPAHHFPTGVTTPADRRRELLDWLAEDPDRMIIEDDYDSEFRMSGRPIPTLFSMDTTGRVIYINTFSKTLAPSLRIAYAVLPDRLCDAVKDAFPWLACPVPVPEQAILASFIKEGYYQRHVRRMRAYYRRLRDTLTDLWSRPPYGARYTVSRTDGGLFFLLTVNPSVGPDMTDRQLCERAGSGGVRVRALSDFYEGRTVPCRTLIISYAGLDPDDAPKLVASLDKALFGG